MFFERKIGASKRLPCAEYMASVLVNYHIRSGILPPQKKERNLIAGEDSYLDEHTLCMHRDGLLVLRTYLRMCRQFRSHIKDSAHLTRVVRIYKGMMGKIRLAVGTLTWIMRFDSNDIAFPNVLCNCVCVSFAQFTFFT